MTRDIGDITCPSSFGPFDEIDQIASHLAARDRSSIDLEVIESSLADRDERAVDLRRQRDFSVDVVVTPPFNVKEVDQQAVGGDDAHRRAEGDNRNLMRQYLRVAHCRAWGKVLRAEPFQQELHCH